MNGPIPEYPQRTEQSLHRNRYDTDSLGISEPRWPQWPPGLYQEPVAIWLEGSIDMAWFPIQPLDQNIEESGL